jgi:hypothetical protein
MHWMKPFGIAGPVLTAQLDHGYTHFAENLPKIRMNAVDELGPEFDGHRRKGVTNSQKAAPRTLSRLENNRFQTPPLQLSSRSEAGDACSDHDGFSARRIFHRPGF